MDSCRWVSTTESVAPGPPTCLSLSRAAAARSSFSSAALPDPLSLASRLINSQLPQPRAWERLSENSFKPNGLSLLSESAVSVQHSMTLGLCIIWF